MEKPKICRGCFKEWNAADTVCPCCGWEPEMEYESIFGWRTGDVFEKRYLLGMPYCRIADIAVWRIYDTVLSIGCLVLRVMPEEKETLYRLAERMQKEAHCLNNSIVLMAVKDIGVRSALLFSIKEQESCADALQKVLAEEIQSDDPPDIREISKYGQKKDLALVPGTMLGGRFEILECIGIGGFGIVYRCMDLSLHRIAAVKEYFPEEWGEREEQYVTVKKSRMREAYRFGLKSFYQEAQIMAKLMHTSHVAPVYDVMEANDTAYLIMRYIPGISIGREMRERNYQPYKPGEIMEIMLPVLETLSEFHSRKIIHGDISPGNIMRSEEGNIFLVDMGAAKYALCSRPVLSAAFLKLDYAAPEQYQTAKKGIPENEGSWTDVYALGATVYYLLTGQKPPDVMQRLSGKRTDVVLPKKCRLKHKRQWTKFFNHAMALSIQERIHTVEELEEELRKLLE